MPSALRLRRRTVCRAAMDLAAHLASGRSLATRAGRRKLHALVHASLRYSADLAAWRAEPRRE